MDKKFLAILAAVVVVCAAALGVVTNGKNTEIATLQAQVADLTAQVTSAESAAADAEAALEAAQTEAAAALEAAQAEAAAALEAAQAEAAAAIEAAKAEAAAALEAAEAAVVAAVEEAEPVAEPEQAEDEPEAEEEAEEAEPVAEVAETEEAEPVAEVADAEDGELTYDDISEQVYTAALGDFYNTYMAAKENGLSVSERYALMAVAEAKLMEAAVMLPTQTRGGNYAMSRVASRTINSTLWGNDSDRFHQAVIATEPIKSEDQTALREKWNELRGTGTYEQAAKDYLTEQGYTLKDTYNYVYTSDPQTWDALATSRAADSEAIVNTFDGLLEYDIENVQQPALATSWEVSEDGTVYTFHIREGVNWVDSQGRVWGPVTADDWVAGMQHMCDAAGGLEYLVGADGGCGIKNIDAYLAGEITDFNEVGVKAVDEFTLEYTLEQPCSFFITMMGYNVFAPMSRTYFESQGGKFGLEYDSADPNYLYGTDPDHIAYNGAYLVTNATANNTIVFSANPEYWNADNINIKTLTWKFNDGSDVLKNYTDFKSGVLDGCGLTANPLEQSRIDTYGDTGETYFDLFHYISATDATSYMAFYNLNREAFANVNDETAVVSTQTEEDAARTNAAINNVHFRRAASFAVDRAAYNAVSVGEELKLTSLRNSYTPANFVTLEEDVTLDIGTFPAGTLYGEIMQAQIDADGVAITVYDPEAEAYGDGFDGWYNPEAAQAELAIAIEELAAAGVEISAENPIYLDLPYPSNSEVYTNRAMAYKQSVENTLGGAVIVNATSCVDYNEWYNTGYYTDFGYEANYDIYDLSGWGPDYGDPATYLDTMLPNYVGYMAKCFGVY